MFTEKNQKTSAPAKSWFARHPKKTLFLIVLFFLVLLTVLTEKLLALKVKPEGLKVMRYIRLRELPPYYFHPIAPSQKAADKKGASPATPTVLRVDRHGYIIPSKVHERPDLTIVFLGGSTTECRQVPEKLRFPYLTGRYLERATDLKVNAFNASRSGNNTLNSIDILLNKVMPLNPDIVIMMHNINDLITLLYEKTYWNTSGRSPLVVIKPSITAGLKEILTVIRSYTIPNIYREFKNLKQRLAKGQVADEFQHIRGKKVTLDKDHLLREFKANLQIFIDICRARQILPVLMTQANRFRKKRHTKISAQMANLERQGIDYATYRKVYNLFNQAVCDLGKANHIPVIDLAQVVPQEEKFIRDVVHFTERGSQLVAETIAREMKPFALSLANKKERVSQDPAGG